MASIGALTTLGFDFPPSENLVETGPSKLTGGSRRTFLAQLEVIKEAFLETVITERADRLTIDRNVLGEAQVYTGMEGLRLGLIDALGGDTEAMDRAAELAGISGYDQVNVNVEALRLRVKQFERVFGFSPGEDDQVALDLNTLGRLFPTGPTGEGAETGVPPGFPIDVQVPQFFYLYVAPTQ